jgi:hypothetical protein
LGGASAASGYGYVQTQGSESQTELEQVLLCCKKITFLGHVVIEDGTRPDPGKIEAVVHFPQPRTVTNVRLFLGLTGYYKKYVKGYARLAAPLFELTRKDVDFVWDMGC